MWLLDHVSRGDVRRRRVRSHCRRSAVGLLGKTDHAAAEVLASGGETYYSGLSDFFFQVVFVATSMSIVSGAVAERMKLWSFFLFCVILTGFIYPVEGYWKWGGGWLNELGYVDFAGSGIVHLSGASAALAGVLLLGARKGKYGRNGQVFAIPGCNLPLSTLGTLILWFGWFGFNGGSQLRVDRSVMPMQWRSYSSTPTWRPPVAWCSRW